MDTLLYWAASGIIGLVRRLPLLWVARFGRLAGAVFYWVDARHRRVALQNLARCFGGERPEAELRALARENFRRIGENYFCAIKTAFMPFEELRRVVEVTGQEKLSSGQPGEKPGRGVLALGHFGNFELCAHFGQFVPGFRTATTYRGLRQPSLNRLLRRLRERSGCLFFDRRHEGNELRAEMSRPGLLLGLLADQHAGDRGLRLPFFGVDCSTSPAPAVFALRYDCPLYTIICHRTGLGRWRLEMGDAIPTHEGGEARAVEAISADVNKAFEAAIRRDPANWFWVHNRWKSAKWRSSSLSLKLAESLESVAPPRSSVH